MNLSVDISLYPLKEEFKSPIKEFIARVENSGFKFKKNNMSTSIYGEYSEIMSWLNNNIEASLLDNENAVFVLKIVGGDYYRE